MADKVQRPPIELIDGFKGVAGQWFITLWEYLQNLDVSTVVSASAGGPAVEDFVDLGDTPAAITANQYVKGNSTGAALQFYNLDATITTVQSSITALGTLIAAYANAIGAVASGGVVTAAATSATICSVSAATSNRTYHVVARASMSESTLIEGEAVGSWVTHATVKNISGTLTVVNQQHTYAYYDVVAASIFIEQSGTDIVLKAVQWTTGHTLYWKGSLEVISST